jgi:endonuclease YncB( thermonuclease family)
MLPHLLSSTLSRSLAPPVPGRVRDWLIAQRRFFGLLQSIVRPVPAVVTVVSIAVSLASIDLAKAVPPDELQEFPNAVCEPWEFNDGDSFKVRFERDGKTEQHIVRLYGVDAFEVSAANDTDRRQLMEQTRHFGFSEKDRPKAVEFGQAAKQRVAELLSKPFKVETVFAQARGSSKEPRIYVFITTHNGKDLGELLVKEGLARAHGIARKRKGRVSAQDYRDRLRDIELQAAVKRGGAWKLADFDRIDGLREEERHEKRKLHEQFSGAAEETPPRQR